MKHDTYRACSAADDIVKCQRIRDTIGRVTRVAGADRLANLGFGNGLGSREALSIDMLRSGVSQIDTHFFQVWYRCL